MALWPVMVVIGLMPAASSSFYYEPYVKQSKTSAQLIKIRLFRNSLNGDALDSQRRTETFKIIITKHET